MVYGSEVVLLTKLEYGSPSVQIYQSDEAEQAQQDAVSLLKELRDVVVARSARHQQTFQ
jgi:hypothetical protein